MALKHEKYRVKWHRSQMMKKGMSRDAIDRKIKELHRAKRIPVPGASKNASPYSRWMNNNRNKAGARRFAPDNGKSPWQHWVSKGGPKKVMDALDLGHDERQAQYKKNKAKKNAKYDAAIKRRLGLQRRGRQKAGKGSFA